MSKKTTEEALKILQKCAVEGLIVRIPDELLDRNIYTEVKGHLELIGGKWKGGKTKGFIFEEDPAELLAALTNEINRVEFEDISCRKVDLVSIKKASLKDDLFLTVEYQEKVTDGTNKVKKECTAPVHDDLKACFRRLDIHLARMADQYNEESLLDEHAISCKGFSIGGSDESEGVTLSGGRVLENGKYMNITTPFYKYADSDSYAYLDELGEIIEATTSEVKQYLFEGKHQPDKQLSLFDQEHDQNLVEEEM